MRGGRVFAALVLLAAFLPPAAHAVTLGHARAVESDAVRARDVPFASSEEVALPDNWLRNRTGFKGVVWYEVPLPPAPAAAREPLVLMATRLADSGTFWLNGERLDFGAAGESSRNRTLWIPLPAAAWRAEGNVLHVRVAGQARTRGGLSQLQLGTAGELRTTYEARTLVQDTVPRLLMFSVAICLFGGFALWLKTRRRMDLVFGLLCLSWVPHAAVLLSPGAASPGQWDLLAALASTLVSNAFVVLLLIEHSKWSGVFWRRYLRVLGGVAVASFALGFALAWAGELRPQLVGVLLWPFFAVGLVPIAAQIRSAWRTRRRSDVSMALTLAFWTATVAHDFLMAADRTAFDAFFWSPVAVLLVLLNLVWRSLESLALHRASADHEINRAVAQERQAVLAEERSRLLHDLHDGLGSQLITALRMTRRDEVPREEVARVIEDSLEDMRLIIDSLDLEERDLLPLLGNLRYRLEPRLNAIGVALHWDAEALPELDYLSPETGLAVVRIVQEAVNNAVRHGNARNITVRARAGGDAIELSVRDDGRGFDPLQPPPKGAPQRGLGAMRMRADRLGGTLAIASGPAGTCVSLALPLRR